MYCPIGCGVKGSPVDWRSFNALSKALLGFIPAPGQKLTKDQLRQLGFIYASGTRPFKSGVYGRISYL